MTKTRKKAANKNSRNKREPSVVSFTLRLPESIVNRLDAMSGDLGVSRQNLIERLLRSAITFGDSFEKSNLFGELGLDDLLESAIKKAVEDASKKLGGGA